MTGSLPLVAHRHPYACILGVLWGLPWSLMVIGYLVLPDDDWDYGCGSIGCGLPSNITYPMLAFWLWLYLLVPIGLLVTVIVALRRLDSRQRPDQQQ